MSTYEVHAYDIVTGARILGDVPFTTFQYVGTLNDQVQRDSHLRPEFYGVLAEGDSASLASLTPGKTMLVVEDTVLGEPIYAGIIWTWVFNREQHGFDVIGESVWSYWRHRHIISTDGMTSHTTGLAPGVVRFDEVEQFDIVTDLIAHAAATGESADLQFDAVTYNPGVSGEVQSTTWNTAQFTTIAEAVGELARQDPGFDFVVSYAWGTDVGAGPPLLLSLDLWHPRFGSLIATTVTDGDNATVNNLEFVAYEMGNPLRVVEILDGPTTHVKQIDDVNRADLGGTYPYLDGLYVTREHGRDASGLEALGTSRMTYTRGPIYNNLQVQLQIGGALAFTDVHPGDTVPFVSLVGGLSITETMRVLGVRTEVMLGELNVWSVDLVDDDASAGLRRSSEDLLYVPTKPAPFFERAEFRGMPGFTPILTMDHDIAADTGERFFPMVVLDRPILFTSFDFIIVGVSGGAGVTGRFAIYETDDEFQPAKLILDSGEWVTDPAFTGLISIPDTVAGLTTVPTLPTDLILYPGTYLMGIKTHNHDWHGRKWRGPIMSLGGPIMESLADEAMVEGMSNADAYGPWPASTTWDTIDTTDDDGFSILYLIGWEPVDPLA